ncbi:MAG: hypothetical protein ACRDSK_13635 [Actinophytocola sp.]|uniref:hypothetical protein n=1 Tax=Actinophytocola sp. TaxID=1872138 RepID=UPI003D6AC282
MVAYPDAVALVIAYLNPLLTPPVVSRVPDPRPPEFLQVRRVGGTDLVVRDQPRLDFFSWAQTEKAAHDLCMQARSLIHATAGTTLLGVTCYRVEEFLGPHSADDDASGLPRYWMTVSLTLRAE